MVVSDVLRHAKAAVNMPQSRRSAFAKAVRHSRSVWTAATLAPLFNQTELSHIHYCRVLRGKRINQISMTGLSGGAGGGLLFCSRLRKAMTAAVQAVQV